MSDGTHARIRCTIAVWDARMRDTLRNWLAGDDDVEMLEPPSGPEQMQWALQQHHPDVVLVAAPKNAAGLLAVHEAAACGPGMGVIVVGDGVSAHVVRRAFAAGAHGFITMDDGPERMAMGIRDVLHNTRYVSPEAAGVLLNAILERPPQPLSAREVQVLSLMAQCVPVREISRRLSISIKTIDTHKQSIFRKLGVHTQRDAVLRGWELGFIGSADSPDEHAPEPPAA